MLDWAHLWRFWACSIAHIVIARHGGWAGGLERWGCQGELVLLFSVHCDGWSLASYVHLKFLSQLGEGAGQEVQAKVGRLPLARVKEGSFQTANSEQIEGSLLWARFWMSLLRTKLTQCGHLLNVTFEGQWSESDCGLTGSRRGVEHRSQVSSGWEWFLLGESF